MPRNHSNAPDEQETIHDADQAMPPEPLADPATGPQGEHRMQSPMDVAEPGAEPMDDGFRFGVSNASHGLADWNGSYIYLRGQSIFASSAGIRLRSYTVDRLSIAPDANGNRILNRGTVMQAYGGTGKAAPRTSGTAIGVVAESHNLRDSDKFVALVQAGALNQTRLWDNGAYGSVAGSVKTDLPFVQFVTYDF